MRVQEQFVRPIDTLEGGPVSQHNGQCRRGDHWQRWKSLKSRALRDKTSPGKGYENRKPNRGKVQIPVVQKLSSRKEPEIKHGQHRDCQPGACESHSFPFSRAFRPQDEQEGGTGKAQAGENKIPIAHPGNIPSFIINAQWIRPRYELQVTPQYGWQRQKHLRDGHVGHRVGDDFHDYRPHDEVHGRRGQEWRRLNQRSPYACGNRNRLSRVIRLPQPCIDKD